MSEPSRPTTLYLGDHRGITRSRYGVDIFFDTRDLSVGLPLALSGDYEPELSAWMIGTLRNGDLAVDVGANIGFYTLHFARRTGPGGHVFAFECNPDLVQLLRDSVEINNLDERCTIHSVAVTDHDGEVEFSKPLKHQGSGSLLPGGLENESWSRITVPATMLDTIFTGREPPMRLLHIDAEAAEPKIIRGARHFLERQRDMIVVLEVVGQTYRNHGDEASIVEALRYLEETGRILCLIQENKPVQISIQTALEFPMLNAAAIPRHLAAG